MRTVIEVEVRMGPLPRWFWIMHVVVIGVSIGALIAAAMGVIR
jgi:hypothetical protein